MSKNKFLDCTHNLKNNISMDSNFKIHELKFQTNESDNHSFYNNISPDYDGVYRSPHRKNKFSFI